MQTSEISAALKKGLARMLRADCVDDAEKCLLHQLNTYVATYMLVSNQVGDDHVKSAMKDYARQCTTTMKSLHKSFIASCDDSKSLGEPGRVPPSSATAPPPTSSPLMKPLPSEESITSKPSRIPGLAVASPWSPSTASSSTKKIEASNSPRPPPSNRLRANSMARPRELRKPVAGRGRRARSLSMDGAEGALGDCTSNDSATTGSSLRAPARMAMTSRRSSSGISSSEYLLGDSSSSSGQRGPSYASKPVRAMRMTSGAANSTGNVGRGGFANATAVSKARYERGKRLSQTSKSASDQEASRHRKMSLLKARAERKAGTKSTKSTRTNRTGTKNVSKNGTSSTKSSKTSSSSSGVGSSESGSNPGELFALDRADHDELGDGDGETSTSETTSKHDEEEEEESRDEIGRGTGRQELTVGSHTSAQRNQKSRVHTAYHDTVTYLAKSSYDDMFASRNRS